MGIRQGHTLGSPQRTDWSNGSDHSSELKTRVLPDQTGSGEGRDKRRAQRAAEDDRSNLIGWRQCKSARYDDYCVHEAGQYYLGARKLMQPAVQVSRVKRSLRIVILRNMLVAMVTQMRSARPLLIVRAIARHGRVSHLQRNHTKQQQN